jgi:hypothetical protein
MHLLEVTTTENVRRVVFCLLTGSAIKLLNLATET